MGITPTITPRSQHERGRLLGQPGGDYLWRYARPGGSTCTIDVIFAPTLAIPSSSTGGGIGIGDPLDRRQRLFTRTADRSFIGDWRVFYRWDVIGVESVAGGQTYMDTISFMLAPGSGTLVLSCTGLSGVLPAGTTCLFSDAASPTPAATLSVPQTGAVQTVMVTITITTTGELFPRRRPDLPPDGLVRGLPLSLIAAIVLFLFWASGGPASKRRARAAWALLALIVLCGGGLAACGGSSSSGGSTELFRDADGIEHVCNYGEAGKCDADDRRGVECNVVRPKIAARA